jgi:hypothetical protein
MSSLPAENDDYAALTHNKHIFFSRVVGALRFNDLTWCCFAEFDRFK